MDGKQQELVKDNFELKDLCLYLDEERNQQLGTPNPEKQTNTSQESCDGDKLSCPQCGYGPIWIVSKSDGNSDMNVLLTLENADATAEKNKLVSGSILKRNHVIKRFVDVHDYFTGLLLRIMLKLIYIDRF